jgi:hypothetical protein
MSTRDDNFKNGNFKDKHLQKALQHAPDSDIAPSEVTSKAVLDYADEALKLIRETRSKSSQESWFSRLKNVFNSWKIPSWQLTGMGSLAASLLVVVMIWHENPDDPMQVATGPSDVVQSEAVQNEAAKNEAVETAPAPAINEEQVTSAESVTPKLQDKVETKAVAKAKSNKQETQTTSQASIEAPADKTVVATAPAAASTQGLEKEADGARLKARPKDSTVTADAAPTPAPIAAAPAPVSEPVATAKAEVNAEGSLEASTDAASQQTAARTAPVNKAAKKMDDAEQAEADLPSTAAAAKPANNTLALALSKQGGQALANKDIQAGKLRILYLSNEAESSAVDDATGYRKEAVLANKDAGEEASLKSLAAEVEAYNQTMREWHLKQK